MALKHKALFTWFMLLVFVILLILRLDGKAELNWFLIFIPLWVFDVVVIIYTLFYMVMKCKNVLMELNREPVSTPKQIYILSIILLKLAFEIVLCLKLEYLPGMNLMLVCIPFWLWAVLVFGHVTHSIRHILARHMDGPACSTF